MTNLVRFLLPREYQIANLVHMEDTQATRPETMTIDSGVIDNRLLVRHAEWVLSELKTASEHLKQGLAKRHTLEGELHFSLCNGIINTILGRRD